MSHYHLYHMNSSSGHIDWLEDIDAADDVAAVSGARQRQDGKPAELWLEGRKVFRQEGRTYGER